MTIFIDTTGKLKINVTHLNQEKINGLVITDDLNCKSTHWLEALVTLACGAKQVFSLFRLVAVFCPHPQQLNLMLFSYFL